MTCPDEHTLGDLVAGALPEEELRRVERHLDGCPVCWEVVVLAARRSRVGEPPAPAPPPRTPAEPPLARGSRVGRYEITGVIGAGGMGIVYAARDPELDRPVAIKLLRPGRDPRADTAEKQRARLLKEGRALAALVHPNVVAIYDVGRHGSRVFLAMELVAGVTLGEWLRTAQRSVAEITACFAAAGRGLAAAHAAGLVHRDFKPDNVIVGADGRVRVTDFGLARSVEASDPSDPSPPGDEPPSLRTQTGARVGTPRYMAPEQHAGGRPDSKADQFAFCVSLYEALYRQAPFAGSTTRELADSVLTGRLRPPPPDARIPRWLRRIVLRGLRTDPSRRYRSMQALQRDLERGPTGRRIAGAAAVITVMAAGIAVAAQQAGERSWCPNPAPELSGAWDGAQRQRLRQRLGSARGWQPVRTALDRYLARWERARRQVCARPRGTAPTAESRRALRCFDWRLTELRALVQSLERAGAARLPAAARAALRLSAPERCARSVDRPPSGEDPTGKAGAWADVIRHLLARGRVARLLGELRSSASFARTAVSAARALGHKPLVAEALHALAQTEEALGRPERAEATGRRAALAGVASGDDTLAARAWLLVLRMVGREGDRAETERAAGQARAALDRVGRPAALEAAFALTRGRWHAAHGEPRRARGLLERAASLLRTIRPRQPLLEVELLEALGRQYRRQGRTAPAARLERRAAALRQELLGSPTPATRAQRLEAAAPPHSSGKTPEKPR